MFNSDDDNNEFHGNVKQSIDQKITTKNYPLICYLHSTKRFSLCLNWTIFQNKKKHFCFRKSEIRKTNITHFWHGRQDIEFLSMLQQLGEIINCEICLSVNGENRAIYLILNINDDFLHLFYAEIHSASPSHFSLGLIYEIVFPFVVIRVCFAYYYHRYVFESWTNELSLTSRPSHQ